MNAWMLPFALILIIIGVVVLAPIFSGFKPALDAGIIAGNYTGNTTTVPHYAFQNALLGNMEWIALGLVIIVAVLGGIAVLWKE